MFHEYAIEPDVISGWHAARYFLDAFGPGKGRFLATYPKRWRKLVFLSLSCGDRDKKRVVEKLAQMDTRAFSRRPSDTYDPEQPWLVSAEVEHLRAPFRAIIARASNGQAHVLEADEVDESHQLWRAESGQLVPRDTSAFAQAVGLLLRLSKHVVIVDPYFRADHGAKLQSVAALRAAADQVPAGFEVHATDQISYSEFKRHAQRAVPPVLSRGARITFHCWSKATAGVRFHNRYLLTDIGGVQFGDSIERGEAGHEDRLSIIGETDRARLMAQYCGTSPGFDPAGASFEVEGPS